MTYRQLSGLFGLLSDHLFNSQDVIDKAIGENPTDEDIIDFLKEAAALSYELARVLASSTKSAQERLEATAEAAESA